MRCRARIRLLAVGLVLIAVLLATPTAGLAADVPPELLAWGAGYESPEGSQPVRAVQRVLRRLGHAPGPVDGLYGPLTTGAVQRFQQEHALVVDGVVGPQTRGGLAVERTKLLQADLERKSPARVQRAESVLDQPAARSPGPAPPKHAARVGDAESSSTGASWLTAVVAGLALPLLLVILTSRLLMVLTSRRGRRRKLASSRMRSPPVRFPAATTQAGDGPRRLLTRREWEVVAMLAEGETNARIAQRLVVSEDTVKSHVTHILSKLGVPSRSQAVSRRQRSRVRRRKSASAAHAPGRQGEPARERRDAQPLGSRERRLAVRAEGR